MSTIPPGTAEQLRCLSRRQETQSEIAVAEGDDDSDDGDGQVHEEEEKQSVYEDMEGYGDTGFEYNIDNERNDADMKNEKENENEEEKEDELRSMNVIFAVMLGKT